MLAWCSRARASSSTDCLRDVVFSGVARRARRCNQGQGGRAQIQMRVQGLRRRTPTTRVPRRSGWREGCLNPRCAMPLRAFHRAGCACSSEARALSTARTGKSKYSKIRSKGWGTRAPKSETEVRPPPQVFVACFERRFCWCQQLPSWPGCFDQPVGTLLRSTQRRVQAARRACCASPSASAPAGASNG